MSIKVFKNIGELLTLKGVSEKDGRHISEKDLGVKTKQALVAYKGQVLWWGSQKKLSKKIYSQYKGKVTEVDLKGKTLLPGFVEAHTHLVFAGDRKQEFEMRNQGQSYQQIAQKGGGILSTVRQTRKAKAKELLELSQQRVDGFVAQGVTTLEAKSGYALDLKNELKMLKVMGQLKGPEIVKTFLGAHALPPEFKTTQAYMGYLCETILPKVAKEQLAERVDIFIEKGYFTPSQAEQLFSKAKEFGLDVCAHTEQLNRTAGFKTLIKYQGMSGEHLVELNKIDLKSLVKSDLTAILLPGADFYLQMKYPKARDLIDQGGRVCLATDFNPGSCPTMDLSFVGVLARLEMKMSLPEVMAAYTWNAAKALGKELLSGSIEVGKQADFAVLNDHWDSLFYQVGYHPIQQTWKKAKKIY